jgi:hypothetical protein
MKIIKILMAFLFFGIFSCSELNEEIRDTINEETALAEVEVSALLTAVYEAHRTPYQDQSRFWAAQQHTTDETLGPTRGPDWDDNGIWRVLHQHTWDSDHSFLSNTFNELLEIVFNASVIIETFGDKATAQQIAEARFIRAFAMFSVLDGWGQVPFRDDLDDFSKDPQVLSGNEAIDFIINETNTAMTNLPERSAVQAYVANKDAARVLLIKAYLNKGTFADRSNPSFPSEDMDQVITLSQQLVGSGNYSVSDNVFDNFAPNNDAISTELIYTNENRGGESSGNVRSRWFCTLHYNQNPSGWNGFTTIADFYDRFDANDERLGLSYDGVTDISGIKVGMLEGQQFDEKGMALKDRSGAPLAFTKEVSAVENGSNLEVTGVRVIKYPIDYDGGDNADNDYVFYRYSDVLLMKAEAHLRKGDEATALDLVNQIRSKRGFTQDLTALTLEDLLDERGFELYWEGHRRTDLIRFGKFLDAYSGKESSGSERLLFPIPSGALASNPNFVQNPGY